MTASLSYLIFFGGFPSPSAPRCLVTSSVPKFPWLFSKQPISLSHSATIAASFDQRGLVETPLRFSHPPRAKPTNAPGSSDLYDLDALLVFAETLCLVCSAVIVIGHAVSYTFPGATRTFFGAFIGSHSALAWGVAALAGGVAFGSWIRRRRRSLPVMFGVEMGGRELNLVQRVEKLEEELKNSVTVIRVLSRQLEKLGIRFRVTRKVLKGPITETAALAQKNSEATRALALQEELLEKELVEMQRVLLAMQEQQQKQLELILSIGSAENFGVAENTPEFEPTRSSDSDKKVDRKLESYMEEASNVSLEVNKKGL